MRYAFLIVSVLVFPGCIDMENEKSQEKLDYIVELGYSEDISNAPTIAAYLNDDDPEVVASASFFLGYLKARSYIEDLAKLLEHENPDIVNMAGAGLREMVNETDEYLLPELYSVLSHDYLLARLSAIEAIGAIKSPSSLQHLVDLFESSSSGQKARIITALGNIGEEEVLPLLESYLNSVLTMDHSVPNKGGTRDVDLHPEALQVITEEAIEAIKNANS